MQNVMVHIDSDLGPVGAWSWHDGYQLLRHFYPESLDLSISGRARQLMAERPPDSSVPGWFHYLATLQSGLDKYEACDVPDQMQLLEVVAEYRRVWNSTV